MTEYIHLCNMADTPVEKQINNKCQPSDSCDFVSGIVFQVQMYLFCKRKFDDFGSSWIKLEVFQCLEQRTLIILLLNDL